MISDRLWAIDMILTNLDHAINVQCWSMVNPSSSISASVVSPQSFIWPLECRLSAYQVNHGFYRATTSGFKKQYLCWPICLFICQASFLIPCGFQLDHANDPYHPCELSLEWMGTIDLLVIRCSTCHITSSSVRVNLVAKWHPTIFLLIWLLRLLYFCLTILLRSECQD